jgi:hypothetical protein
MNLEEVKNISYHFMEKEYPHEAPYFHIAWDIFQDFQTTAPDSIVNLKRPMVRLNGDSTVMAPRVIQAYYILFLTYGENIHAMKESEEIGSAMVAVLSKKGISSQFSEKIVDFLFESRAPTG